MSKTAAHVKNKWNEKTYDRFTLMFKPKGRKAEVQAHAAAQGKSLNGYIVDLIDKDMEKKKDVK